MNVGLVIVRAAHVLDYVAVLREVGAPVDADLSKSRLPPAIEEMPNHYVGVVSAIEWIARCGRDLEPMELGCLAAGKASLASLKPSHAAAIVGAQTGLRRLEAVLRIAPLEDSGVRASVQTEGDRIRVFCDMPHLERHPFICFAEWLNLQAVVSVLRSVAGATWSPQEMCFTSSHPPSNNVREAFPKTRILVDQPKTSLLIDPLTLALPTEPTAPPRGDPAEFPWSEDDLGRQASAWTFAGLLRQIVQPYLNGGAPDLAFTARLAGMSKRTLQRRLLHGGASFSEVIQEARFELACLLLGEPSARIIDVAMTSGYENPQHFSRAFRRFTGLTPTAYRRDILQLPAYC